MELLQFTSSHITLLMLFLFLFKLVKELKRSKATTKLPPGPWKLPLIGNILHLGSLPHHALRDFARKYGPLMHIQLGEISTVVISSPRVAKEVLKAHDLAFAERPKILGTKIVMYNNTNIATSPYGDYWRQMRKFCTMELLSAKKVRSFCSIREDETWRLIESIKLSLGSPINLTEKIFSSTNAITCRAVFGKKFAGQDRDALITAIQETMASLGGYDVADLFPSLKLLHVFWGMKHKLEEVHHKVDQIFDKIINERIENLANTKKENGEPGSQEDLLDVLLRLKEAGDLEFSITADNVKAILMDMFAAGTDTSSIVVEWAMSELIRQPRVMKKTQAELRQALKGKKIIHETDIQGLPYLKFVIKETLRLRPAAPLISRECREQCKIDGYDIPIKTKVLVNAWALGRDPKYWDDAESFTPERFENSSVDFTGSNLEFIPFGSGKRICPGISFGLANVELPLAQLLYHFNWKLPNIGMKPENLDMSETLGATCERKYNLYVIATSHSPCDDSS